LRRLIAASWSRNPVQRIPVRGAAAVFKPWGLLRIPDLTRTGVMWVKSDLGTMEAVEMLRSHVNARAIEAVCRLTANSLDLETLM
jgi:hypothetical protein